MRIGVVCVALLVSASAISGWGQSPKEAKPETVARWHFAGTRQVADEKDLSTLRQIITLPQSSGLRNVALSNFASHVAQRFTRSNDTNANRGVAALIQPLLPDLLENETSFELTARGTQDADWALALKLAPERVADWNKNLTELARAAQMNVSPGEKSAWSASRDNYRLSFAPEKDWLFLEGGFGAPDQTKKNRSQLTRRLGKDLLTAEVNFPKIAEMWSADRFQHAPKLNLTVTPRKGVVRSEMEITYPQSLNITPERFAPPMDLIHDPLIGFTAVQGLSDVYSRTPELRSLGAEKSPNQLFLWNQSTMAFTVFAASDVGNPATVITNIVQSYLPGVKDAPGRIIVATNRPGILWRGLPIAVPFVEAANEGRSPYLVAGLFPIKAVTEKPAPRELFEQLRKKNLVLYDWEISQERLRQWRPIWQFAQMVQGRIFPPSASDSWIDAVLPLLVGNSVTEVTLEKKDKLKLVRTSETGLTALELLLLAHAVDPNDVVERQPHAGAPTQPRRQNRPTQTAPVQKR